MENKTVRPNEEAENAAKEFFKMIKVKVGRDEIMAAYSKLFLTAYKQGYEDGYKNCLNKIKGRIEAAQND